MAVTASESDLFVCISVFPSDTALEKMLYLASGNVVRREKPAT
jgi:hypothetical protein